MNIYELSRIGQFHLNHNEDFLLHASIGQDKLLIAVMDGCSTGTDSYFAATLIGKVLRKIAKSQDFKSFILKEKPLNAELLQLVMKDLFAELVHLNSRLDLKEDELLSTLILGIIDTSNRSAEILAIGDGMVSVDGRLIEYEQDNKPDYLGYHLTEDFENWYLQQQQRLSIDTFYDLSISTDGIHTFKPFDDEQYLSITPLEIIDLLYNDVHGKENENMLGKKLFDMEKKYGLKPSDDLTIIRIIFGD